MKSSLVATEATDSQYVLRDPYASRRHLRIYTVVYENDEPNECETLVYAEDLSRNGTYWDGSLIGRGSGGFLLSDGNVLTLTSNTQFTFTALPSPQKNTRFDQIQENEMAVWSLAPLRDDADPSQQFRQEYMITERLLGAGAFGKVFMAVEQKSRLQVACKLVDLRKLVPWRVNRFGPPERPTAAKDLGSQSERRSLREWVNQQKRGKGVEAKMKLYLSKIEILTSINHPNIIGIEKVFITDDTMYMMQNLVTAGDLFSYIESRHGKLQEAEAAAIIRQILIAVSFLHKRNIVHRDIKPDNILMTSSSAGCRIVLTDFGAARRIDDQRDTMSTQIGTHEYAAPEMFFSTHFPGRGECRKYTRAVDMWALGCVAVVLLTGGLAFCDPVTNHYSEKLAKDCDLAHLQASSEWQHLRDRPRSFVENLLVIDENARMTADEGLNHCWFSNEAHKADFEDLYQRTIKTWRSKPPKDPVVEFLDSGLIQQLPCSQNYLEKVNKKFLRRSGHTPIEEPFKPFPRTMHTALSPRRRPNDKLSDEIRQAIDTKWPPVSESAVVLEKRTNNVSEGRQSPWFRIESTRRLRRTTASPAPGKEPQQADLSPQSRRSMPSMPLRIRDTRSENTNSAESSSVNTDPQEGLKENFSPSSRAPSGSRLDRDESPPFGDGSTGLQQQKIIVLKLSNISGTVLHERFEHERTTGVTIAPYGTSDVLVTRSESHRLVPVNELKPLRENPSPGKGRTLKRRGSLLNFQASTKVKRRRGSIYDLVADNDSDGGKY
ncbi:hypothetical protein LTR84_002964 [Exophiala bonariae]|uniref:Protein kinase domain-containing protein n=1 Tax=Exophiala bonariae TaxID=1690606 RepID=A0AAV9NBI8_9EURO|nr:hypothetical protein LTR84_002964 [Exophiala bonariae]